ncbi:hypothetical protein [Paraburkholderia sp. J41]|uniref:hypothetical protein n=1 Tax=Paraburkholderia sp. J41 TaxID=2805433 RepID=UPI002AC3415A|nr:hypothetical protein [Paraburkholderia sp. J41]
MIRAAWRGSLPRLPGVPEPFSEISLPKFDRMGTFVVFRLSMKVNKNNDLRQTSIRHVLLRCKTSAFRLPSLTLERVLHFAPSLTKTLQAA